MRRVSKDGWVMRCGRIADAVILGVSPAGLAFGPSAGMGQEQMRDMWVMNLFLDGTFLVPVASFWHCLPPYCSARRMLATTTARRHDWSPPR